MKGAVGQEVILTVEMGCHPRSCDYKKWGGCGCSTQERESATLPAGKCPSQCHCSHCPHCQPTHRNPQTKPGQNIQLPCVNLPLQTMALQVNCPYGQSHLLSIKCFLKGLDLPVLLSKMSLWTFSLQKVKQILHALCTSYK